MYVHTCLQIICSWLLETVGNETTSRMKQIFDKHWGNVAVFNPLLFMVMVLNPRFKLKCLDFGASMGK
jgi:glycopeptide antibiotics resistance protein